MRTFIALDLDEASLDRACGVVDRLRPKGPPRAKWVARRNMHLTLAFLGEIEETFVPPLAKLVAELGRSPEPGVQSARCAALPRSSRARVVALELTATRALIALEADARRRLEAMDLPGETRPFRPHLTLARLRSPADVRDWLDQAPAPIDLEPTRVTLYRSDQQEGGPVYTALAWAPFGGGSPL